MKEFDEIEAGQKLDLMIAEKVMGWRNLEWRKGKNDGRTFSPEGYYGEGPDRACYLTHGYSTNIASAWLVVESMRNLGWFFTLDDVWPCAWKEGKRSEWRVVRFCNGATTVEGMATSEALAICRAALKAATTTA